MAPNKCACREPRVARRSQSRWLLALVHSVIHTYIHISTVNLGNTLYAFLSDIDLKVAAKFFGTKFACGSSVTGDDEIVIQGDVKDDLFDIIPEKWPEVSHSLPSVSIIVTNTFLFYIHRLMKI